MIAELSAIQAAASSLKTAGEIVKGMIGLKVAADVQAKIIELQSVILAAQSGAMSAQAAQTELLERVRQLENELVRLENWEAEKQRYHLQKFEPGTYVYVLKEEAVKAGEPIHAICPSCHERGRKFILQSSGEMLNRRRVFNCCNRECGARFALGGIEPVQPQERQPDYKTFD